MKRILFFVLATAFSWMAIYAQSINYAAINKEDVEHMNFEILGKAADNYLVYKEVKGKHRISVYDYNMQLREEIPITILPNKKDVLDLSFYNLGNHRYLIFQHQEGDIVYLKSAAIEANGRIVSQPTVLDTTMIAYKTDNKIYNVITSNDGNKLMIFKINKKDKRLYRFTTKLFNAALEPVSESYFSLPMEYQGDYLTGYSITNNGSYAFIKYHRQANGNIVDATLIEKPAESNAYDEYPLKVNDLFLDDLKLMVDEVNNRYLLSSFYSTKKRGNVDGMYVYAMERDTKNVVFEKTTLFNDDLKKRASSRSSRNAFNNFFINNIIVNEDGSFLVASEALYNTNNQDRWGYWGGWGPGWGGMWGAGMWGGGWGWGWGRWGGMWPYSYYSPFFYRSYWWGGWGGSGWSNSAQYNAGNIVIISFDEEGNKTWDNVIAKSQSQNNTDGSISYQILQNESGTVFLMNNSGKISDLENITINHSGNVQKGAPIKAKEKRINFMPKYGRQTENGEFIMPYSYKRNISFVKVEL